MPNLDAPRNESLRREFRSPIVDSHGLFRERYVYTDPTGATWGSYGHVVHGKGVAPDVAPNLDKAEVHRAMTVLRASFARRV